jgi:iron complex transport system ATP-binding protein
MIQYNDVTYKIGSKTILNHINLSLKKGISTAIIGPNGSGKSTLIHMLSRWIDSYEGNITLHDKNIKDMDRKILAKEVGFLIQSQDMMMEIQVEEVIKLGRTPHHGVFQTFNKVDQLAYERAVEMTDTKSLLHRNIATLSGGERQRVYIAMLLCQNPNILILDEPTNHLDIKYQLDILNLIQKLKKTYGITTITVFHDINQALRFSDEIVVLKDGNVFAQGLTQDIINKPLMKEVFGLDVHLYQHTCNCMQLVYQYE